MLRTGGIGVGGLEGLMKLILCQCRSVLCRFQFPFLLFGVLRVLLLLPLLRKTVGFGLVIRIIGVGVGLMMEGLLRMKGMVGKSEGMGLMRLRMGSRGSGPLPLLLGSGLVLSLLVLPCGGGCAAGVLNCL